MLRASAQITSSIQASFRVKQASSRVRRADWLAVESREDCAGFVRSQGSLRRSVNRIQFNALHESGTGTLPPDVNGRIWAQY